MGLNAEYGKVVTKSGESRWTFITSKRIPALDRLA